VTEPGGDGEGNIWRQDKLSSHCLRMIGEVFENGTNTSIIYDHEDTHSQISVVYDSENTNPPAKSCFTLTSVFNVQYEHHRSSMYSN